MDFPIHLTNTLTKQKELFTPIDATNVRLYTCGVTPYDYAHIGNTRAAVMPDVLFRLLRWRYGAVNVTYVRNFTDVDDKIIARAQETGADPLQLPKKFIAAYQADMSALGCLPPTHEPLVTEEMPEIVALIEQLITNGHAYVTARGDVNYDITTKADYGKLSRKKLADLIANARVDIDSSEKKNAGDFALWKAAKAGEPSWDSPWGPGRPGWHIECSAMSEKYLGSPFDIHTGGEDLQFPHHENEIAQSEGAHSGGACDCKHVNFWLHNAFITVGGQRMGKSMGNFTTVRDALEIASGGAVRLWLLQTHYRKPVDFTPDVLKASQKRLNKLHRALDAAEPFDGVDICPETSAKMAEVLGDDMNTSKALAILDVLRAKVSADPSDGTSAATLAWGMGLLGLKS